MPVEEMRRSTRLQMLGYEPPDESDWVTGLHPMDELLRGERLPHNWCQGCGLGASNRKVQQARAGAELIYCGTCGRILYVP